MFGAQEANRRAHQNEERDARLRQLKILADDSAAHDLNLGDNIYCGRISTRNCTPKPAILLLAPESLQLKSNLRRFREISAIAEPERNSGFCYLYKVSMDINPGQILSLALATVPTMLTVLIGILINNSRLTDLRSHMDSRFDDMRAIWHTPPR
jgi:hypothetical protein